MAFLIQQKHIRPFTLLWLLYPLVVFGQYNYADSVKQQIESARHDTLRIHLLSRLALYYLNSGNKTEAVAVIKQGQALSAKSNYLKGIGQYYNAMGILSRMDGKNEQALAYYRQAFSIALKLNNKKTIAACLHNIARIYDNQGNYKEALRNLFASLHIKEGLNDKMGMANTLGHIGHIYLAMGNYKKALENHSQALQLEKDIKNKAGIIIALNDIGCVYEAQRAFKSAEDFFHQALVINTPSLFKPELASSLRHLGVACSETGRIEAAKNYYKQAIAALDSLTDEEQHALIMYEYGRLYLKTGETSKALDCFLKAEQLAKKAGTFKARKEANLGLSDVYKTLQKPELALFHYQQYIHLKDCLLNQSVARTLLQKEIEAAYEKKHFSDSLQSVSEKKLLDAKVKQQTIRNYFLVALILVLVLIAWVIVQRVSHRQKMKLLAVRNKMAIDLHDEVGSSLSSIKLLAGVAKIGSLSPEAKDLVNRIEHTSIETMESMSDIVWNLQPKNDHFTSLLNKMERLGKELCTPLGIQFHFTVKGAFDKNIHDIEKRKNVYLIYKEAINNALKYATCKTIDVLVKEENKWIEFRIKDNGIGFDPEQKNSGNGLDAMHQRAVEMNAQYTLTSAPGKGTLILLKFKTT